MDPTSPHRLLRTGGKLIYLQEENPCSWGRKNPISSLSRIKNPDLLYLYIAAALRAYSMSSSLNILNFLGTTTSFSSAYPKLGFTTSQLGLAD